MSRYIDADALDRAFSKLRFNNDGELEHYGDRQNWYLWGSEVENLIADAPSIDIEPKRGEWINVSGSWSPNEKCSVCGEVVHEYNYNFCPNCGADMRGEKDETD